MQRPDKISIVLKADEFDVHVKAAFYDHELAIRYAEIIQGWVESSSIEDAYERPKLSSRTTITASCSKRQQSDRSNADAYLHEENNLDDGEEQPPRADYTDYAGVQCVIISRTLDSYENIELAKKEMRKLVRDYLRKAMELREDGHDPLRIQSVLQQQFSENQGFRTKS